jgi:glycosyltransferase involved in cell wall biosynthesis
VHNIQDILCKYDAYISTSSYEGYGIAPMEALAKGLPLFLSDIPVYREIYKDHCFFFEVGQNVASALVAACTRYSNLSDAERNSLKIEWQQYAYAIANSKTYRQKLMDIYNS